MDHIKSLVTRSYDAWNAHDRDGWLACFNESATFEGPGGLSGRGFDTGRIFWSLWQDAFPDCQCTINVAVAEGNDAMQEAVFSGTHTDTLHTPNSGDIPPTGKTVAIPYALATAYSDGKWSSFHIIFDQVDLMTQLGLMPTEAPTGA
jgi:predicted ester cyclase